VEAGLLRHLGERLPTGTRRRAVQQRIDPIIAEEALGLAVETQFLIEVLANDAEHQSVLYIVNRYFYTLDKMQKRKEPIL
jgi:hypothetical protein